MASPIQTGLIIISVLCAPATLATAYGRYQGWFARVKIGQRFRIGLAWFVAAAFLANAAYLIWGLDQGPPDFSRSPMKHTTLHVSFFGSGRAPQLMDGTDVYRPIFNCFELGMKTQKIATGQITDQGSVENCFFTIVWKRPIDADKITVAVDGQPTVLLPVQKNENYSPYITTMQVNGPLIGVMSITVDAKG